MSHSQFHCLLLKLRHAWLNLWDKHMTTGRINQVTISERHPPKQDPQGVHWTNLVTNLRVCYRFVSSTDNWVDTRRHESSELALVWPVTLCSSTIPVLLTLLVFSAAQKSSRSASSLKIAIRVIKASSTLLHVSLRMCNIDWFGHRQIVYTVLPFTAPRNS